MREITNITDQPHQRHIVPLDESEITLVIRFIIPGQFWIMDVEWQGKSVRGVKLSAGVLHITSSNFPFDFVITTTKGLDPFKVDDFAINRCKLYILDPDEMEIYRGVQVEV